MVLSQSAEDQNRKRAVAQGVGGKPTNVKTFAKRQKANMGGPIGAVNMTRMKFL